MASGASPQHFITVDPDKEWSKGVVGFFHRWRGLAATGVVKLVGIAGVQWFFQNWASTVVVAVASATIWGLLLYDRRHLMWCWGDKRTLHSFCHWLRDESLHRPATEAEFAGWAETFSEKACDLVADHFQIVFADPTITSAIRLAKTVGGEELFVTVGRSRGMDPSRPKNSKGIKRDKGIAKILMDKDSLGVWIIPDIQKATALAMWEKTGTDDLDDVRFVMAAPINGFEGDEKAMLGILYVCSARRPFRPLDTVEVRGWADMLGLAYFDASRTIVRITR